MSKEEELEFMTVPQDGDDDEDFNRMDTRNNRFEESDGDVIGSWFLKQSKVCLENTMA